MSAHAHSKPTVLVVDDAPAVSTTLLWVLCENGFEGTIARSQAEAVKLCREFLPDVALIETSLPDGTGIDTACELHRRVPGCRMLLMSGDPEAGDYLQRARAAGLDCELLPKPIPVADLLAKLRSALAHAA